MMRAFSRCGGAALQAPEGPLMNRLTPSVLLTAALALSPFLAPALAQAPPPAPKTATLGGGSGGGGPLLTREELRACMKQQTELGTRRSTLEAQSQTLEQDKAAVLAEVDALKAERAKIETARAAVADINARQSELSARIAQWNERVKVLNEGRRPTTRCCSPGPRLSGCRPSTHPARTLRAGVAQRRCARTETSCVPSASRRRAPDFDNTVAAFDRSGRLLGRIASVFYNLTASETSPALQAVQRQMAAPLAAHDSAVYMDAALFARVDALHEAREQLALTPSSAACSSACTSTSCSPGASPGRRPRRVTRR
jgi:hypothetical protein